MITKERLYELLRIVIENLDWEEASNGDLGEELEEQFNNKYNTNIGNNEILEIWIHKEVKEAHKSMGSFPVRRRSKR